MFCHRGRNINWEHVYSAKVAKRYEHIMDNILAGHLSPHIISINVIAVIMSCCPLNPQKARMLTNRKYHVPNTQLVICHLMRMLSDANMKIECEITKIVLKRRKFSNVFSFFINIMRKFVP